jgi:membrane-bound ClpP family serine protease
MSLTYIAKEGDIFEVRYKSYYGVIGAIFLILVLWVSVVVNFNLTGLILTTIGSPLLFYVASLFSEKFTLNLNSKQKEGIVILCKGLLNIKQTRYQFSINEIKELVY